MKLVFNIIINAYKMSLLLSFLLYVYTSVCNDNKSYFMTDNIDWCIFSPIVNKFIYTYKNDCMKYKSNMQDLKSIGEKANEMWSCLH